MISKDVVKYAYETCTNIIINCSCIFKTWLGKLKYGNKNPQKSLIPRMQIFPKAAEYRYI